MPTLHYFHDLSASQQRQAQTLVGDLQPEWHCYLTDAGSYVVQALPLQPILRTGAIRLSVAARVQLAAEDRREMEFVVRHAIGDWSEIPATEQAANHLALAEEGVIASRFALGTAAWVYVTTQADRKATHVTVGRSIERDRFPDFAFPTRHPHGAHGS
ncbi:hypothetical protein DF134_35095 [Burkholderia stagnalis]|uniref:hypothetical protein n=1 Tax=Burkholderia stagnalis TaxID=1503054 RepID=UPI000F5A251A|nr:hypothetical protein [Burkholderia stagnalis]RQQ79039.1 hypothetical protein DF134_35095 [Burkholderia stagnalis]